MQAAQTQWFLHGGDLAAGLAEGLAILENGIGADPATWLADDGKPGGPSREDPGGLRRSKPGTPPGT